MDSLRTLRDFLRWGASRFAATGVFFGHGTTGAADEAAVLIAHALHLDLPLAPEFLDAALTAGERAAVLAVFERRVTERLPAPYLTGEAWFAGLRFAVDPRVLIPRSPIAELIERGFAPWFDDAPPARILDIGTGSGCIALACALAFPAAEVDATDLSADALAVATRNRQRHGLEARVRLIAADVYPPDAPRYDLIVSNPPYVPNARVEELPDEYLREPAMALFSGDEGFDCVDRIIAGAAERLAPGGVLVVEVGEIAEALDARYAHLPLTWLEFEHGGEGVFLISREDLLAAQA